MAEAPEENYPEAEGKKKKKKENKAGRGVETLFRITAANQMRLSDMADNKAHILLTINSIIVSILLSVLFRKIDAEPELLIPSILFLFTSLVTIVLAILVTMPRIKKSEVHLTEASRKNVNLLFFGDYHSISLLEYEKAFADMMQDPKSVYSSMIKDNYHLGLVLQKKYTSLRFAYIFFMVSFIVSAVSFVYTQVF